jgi:hypothetical protein
MIEEVPTYLTVDRETTIAELASVASPLNSRVVLPIALSVLLLVKELSAGWVTFDVAPTVLAQVRLPLPGRVTAPLPASPLAQTRLPLALLVAIAVETTVPVPASAH